MKEIKVIVKVFSQRIGKFEHFLYNIYLPSTIASLLFDSEMEYLKLVGAIFRFVAYKTFTLKLILALDGFYFL